MTKLKSLMTGTTAIVLLLGGPSWAAEQPGLGIADNDSIYVDGNSFKIVPGKGKGDASALIKKLDAHAVGSGMIIFRSGDTLYVAGVPPSAIQTGGTRYGSDRDTSVSAAQAERDWRDWQAFTRQNPRYGSDRDTSASPAQAERDWQDFLNGKPRYGSDRDDRGGIDVGPLGQCFDPGSAACRAENLRGNNASSANARARFGSDRDTSVSAAQAERDWRDWQAFTRQNPRYGSDRDTSASPAQAERDWQEFLNGNNASRANASARYGSDRDDRGGIDVGPLGQCFDPGSAACRTENLRGNNASRANARARYGSDRDTSVSAAQAERDWRDWQAFTRQNPRYGSDRDTSVSAAQAERDWQEYLSGKARFGSDRDTSVSAAQAERDWQDFLRNSRFGSDRVVINDPEYAQYKLKKIFDENWTASDSK